LVDKNRKQNNENKITGKEPGIAQNRKE